MRSKYWWYQYQSCRSERTKWLFNLESESESYNNSNYESSNNCESSDEYNEDYYPSLSDDDGDNEDDADGKDDSNIESL